jgi:hypothetical protein
MHGNLGNSTAMVFEGSITEGDDNGDDSEIAHSNDDFEMSRPSPVQSPSSPLENTSSIGSIGRRQK